MRIRIQHFWSMWIRIQIHGFDDQKFYTNLQLKQKLIFFYQKLKFTLPRPPINDVQDSELHDKPSALKR
jgi:hypothetical protein